MASIILFAGFNDRPTSKDIHFHDCHQLIYVNSGRAIVEVGERRFVIGPGNLVLFSRLENHRVMAEGKGYQRYVADISANIPSADPETYRLFSILFNRPKGFSNLLHINPHDTELPNLFCRLTKEFNGNAPMRDDMLDLLIRQMFIGLYRRFPTVLPLMDDGSYELVSKIQQKLELDYADDISLQNLSEAFGFSVSYICHTFKKITGTSVMDYLKACRLAAAKQYLAQSALSISEIVDRCGFTDHSNFSRSFKAYLGCTPSQFRQTEQTEKSRL